MDQSPFRVRRRVEFRDTDAAGIVHFSAFFPMLEAAEHEFLRNRGISVLPRKPQTTGDQPIGDQPAGDQPTGNQQPENSQAGGSPRAEAPAVPQVTWPRVSATCDYHQAARFEDWLDIDVSVEKLGNSSVTYLFQVHRGDVAIATGRIVAVCCRLDHGHLEKCEIPAELRARLSDPER
ncbi:MAG: thioesterase family protein [Planctomycetota bacterium]